jgi:hypothetical protein
LLRKEFEQLLQPDIDIVTKLACRFAPRQESRQNASQVKQMFGGRIAPRKKII